MQKGSQGKRRIIAIGLFVCFVLTLVISSMFLFAERDHDCKIEICSICCSGSESEGVMDACPVCHAIETARKLLRSGTGALQGKTVTVQTRFKDVIAIVLFDVSAVVTTLVTLKVKLTD